MKTINEYFRGYKDLFQFEGRSPEYLVNEESIQKVLETKRIRGNLNSNTPESIKKALLTKKSNKERKLCQE